MSNTKIELTAAPGVNEIVVREGKANDIHVPNGIEIGQLTIDAVKEYLSKEGIDQEEIKNSYVFYSVDDEEPFIQLRYASRKEKYDNIHGKLTMDPDLKKFGVNTGNQFTPANLANFIRLNRHYFETKDQAMSLVTALQNFKANVEKEIEKANDNRGNAALVIKQKVISNVPLDFTLYLPIFKGTEKRAVKCEIDIDASDLLCSLVSPDLKELLDVESKLLIDAELDVIRKLYPQLRIFRN